MNAPGTGEGLGNADLLSAIVESSSDAIAVLDPQSRLRYANKALWRELGREPGGAGIEDLLTLVHPDDVASVRARFADALTDPSSVTGIEFRISPPDGRTRYVEARAANRTTDQAVLGTVLSIRDVTDRVHLDNALRTVRAGNQMLVRSTDELSLLRGMCDTIVHAGGYLLAWVGYAEDDEARTVVPVAGAGDVNYVTGLRISWADDEFGRGPTGMAIRTNSVQVERDIRESASFHPWRERAMAHGFRTSCVLPLSKKGRVIGAISIYSGEVGAFDAPSLELLHELADDLIYGIARLRDAARLTAAFDATVGALRTMSELRDPYTAGHQHRVGLLAGAIASALELPDPMPTWIRVAGELHDIGKVIVPAEILARPGKLSDPEMEIVRGHPRAGFEIVRGIQFPGQVAEMVLQHHERLDGSGYPNGLRGEEILMGSRILAVADTVEAMCNHRPYRPALGLDAALDTVKAGAGSVFDPVVVSACVGLFDRDEFTFADATDPTTSGGWVQPLRREIPRAAADAQAR